VHSIYNEVFTEQWEKTITYQTEFYNDLASTKLDDITQIREAKEWMIEGFPRIVARLHSPYTGDFFLNPWIFFLD